LLLSFSKHLLEQVLAGFLLRLPLGQSLLKLFLYLFCDNAIELLFSDLLFIVLLLQIFAVVLLFVEQLLLSSRFLNILVLVRGQRIFQCFENKR
jgi:hypothetical protein